MKGSIFEKMLNCILELFREYAMANFKVHTICYEQDICDKEFAWVYYYINLITQEGKLGIEVFAAPKEVKKYLGFWFSFWPIGHKTKKI